MLASPEASTLGARDCKAPTFAFGHAALFRSTGTKYSTAWMNRVVPVLSATNTALLAAAPLLCRNIGHQRWSVALSVNHTAFLTSGIVYEFYFFFMKKRISWAVSSSVFWLFTSDFEYPRLFFTVFCDSGRLTKEKWVCMKYRGTFFDLFPSVVQCLLV